MNNKTYFLPIKSENLAFYFAKGCICPTKYLQNRNTDIQNRFDNQILLSNSMFTNETDCSLEIILNEETEKAVQISNSFFTLEMPLPISRIKKITFKNEEQKINTVYNIESGAAFLPLNLIEVVPNSIEINTEEFTSINNQNSLKDWSKELEQFDRLMGGFAVMSIAGNDPQNYPTNYFNTLSVINDLVRDEIINQEVEVKNNQEWAIIRTEKFNRLYDAIYNKINNSTVENFAKVDKVQLLTNNGKYLIDKISQEKLTYFVAILASYGEGTRQSIDTFISDIISNKFPIERKEGIALIFGINKGYDVFRNNYKTNNFNVDVKFKLDSQLDYYTIESIYQFTFNNKRDNSDFEYLSWVSEYENEINDTDFETYQVLDKTIIIKKKEKIGFKEIFQSISRNKIYQKIISEINKCIPKYLIDKDDIEGTKYFTNLLKEDFEEYEIEIYKNAKEVIEKELNNKFDKKHIDNCLEIDKLNNIIFEQNKKIKDLEEIIEKSKSNKNDNIKDFQEPNEPLGTTINSSSENSVEVNKLYTEKAPNENLVNEADNIEILVVQNDNSNRKQELKKLNITNLRKEAEKFKVDNFKAFKNNPDDMDKLIEAILYVESQKGIF
ncbi:hypothetical protein [Flavobacterium sp. 123]|uniref:hypothetical protein n=1 Tax=Flavobacterium sp. 123 TaxID=2135627 RepID=UPI000EAE2F12|nr:hypothetical protein [Flavobacterium sp. 123]RKT00176.1 hypothetical protein C8C88_1995 [Flavobacterium sp. 123]